MPKLFSFFPLYKKRYKNFTKKSYENTKARWGGGGTELIHKSSNIGEISESTTGDKKSYEGLNETDHQASFRSSGSV